MPKRTYRCSYCNTTVIVPMGFTMNYNREPEPWCPVCGRLMEPVPQEKPKRVSPKCKGSGKLIERAHGISEAVMGEPFTCYVCNGKGTVERELTDEAG